MKDFLTRATCSGVPWATMRPPSFAAFGAEIDDPVGLFDDVEMVLDDQHGVAERDETIQHVEKFFHVVEVQAGGGLVENVERAAGLAARKFAGQLGALGFAAGKRGGGLAELDVAEADVDERLQLLLDRGNIFERPSELPRWANRADRKS